MSLFKLKFLFIMLIVHTATYCLGMKIINESSVFDDVAVFESKLLPQPDGVGSRKGYFGSSISIDGNQALIGGTGLAGYGAALVFDYDGTSWIESAILRPSLKKLNQSYGLTVALSGTTAMVSANSNSINTGETGRGIVYVYENTGANWVEVQVLSSNSKINNNNFGLSVSISGNHAIIGSPNSDISGNRTGAAHLYERQPNGKWVEVRTFFLNSGYNFGYSVNILNNQLLIGAPGRLSSSSSPGTVYVYEYKGGEWMLLQNLLSEDETLPAPFGGTITQSSEWIVVGSDLTRNQDNLQKVHVFRKAEGVWVKYQSLLSSDWDNYHRFGRSLSITGNQMLIGSYESSFEYGSVYLFEYENNQWIEKQIFENPDNYDFFDRFGKAIAINNNHIFIGSDGDDVTSLESGSISHYSKNGNDWIYRRKYIPKKGASRSEFGSAISMDREWLAIGARGDDERFAVVPGFVNLYRKENSHWTFFQRLYDDEQMFGFGTSLSLDGERLAAGFNLGYVNKPVYIFEFNGVSWNKTAKIDPKNIQDSSGFGSSISLSANRLMVGAPYEFNTINLGGAVFFYELTNNSWVQNEKIFDPEGLDVQYFGKSVSIHGNKALIGVEYGVNNQGQRLGSAYLYMHDGNNWSFSTKLFASKIKFPRNFGSKVIIENERMIISDPWADNNVINHSKGVVFVFEFDGSNWFQSQIIESPYSEVSDYFGYSSSLHGNKLVIGGMRDFTNGYVILYEYDGVKWNIIQKVDDNKPEPLGLFGTSIGLNFDTLVIGAPGQHDNGTLSGSAYLYGLKKDLIYCQNFDFETTCDDMIYRDGFETINPN